MQKELGISTGTNYIRQACTFGSHDKAVEIHLIFETMIQSPIVHYVLILTRSNNSILEITRWVM